MPLKTQNFMSLIRKALLLIFVSTLFINKSHAQQVAASAKLDSMVIFIGGQIDLTLEVTQSVGQNVNFPLMVDTISKSVEIVEVGKIDTSKLDNNRLLLKQVYRITSFDSGVHLIPAIRFELADAQADNYAQTQPMAIKVVNPFEVVDPEKGIFDIKQPVNTPFNLAELLPYLPYFLGFILFVGIVTGLLIWRFNRKLLLPFLNKEKPIEPPHVIALRELERIRQEKIWQKGLVKQYYIQLTDVVRQYMETRFDMPVMEQTSDETLAATKNIDAISVECWKNLQQLLTTADLAKFAKMEPRADENDLCLMHALFFVNQTKVEEAKSLEELKAVHEETANQQ